MAGNTAPRRLAEDYAIRLEGRVRFFKSQGVHKELFIGHDLYSDLKTASLLFWVCL